MSSQNSVPYAHIVADWLLELGYTHCFFVAGGGCMVLLEGFRSKFIMVPTVHEMSAGVAAEHFNECSSSNKAFCLVTTGPGVTNIITPIAGSYAERRPLLVIAGQVKTTDRLNGKLRQRGVQEVDATTLCTPITVHSSCIISPIKQSEFKRRALLAEGPHPGPVFIEICLDVQGELVEPDFINDHEASASTIVQSLDWMGRANVSSISSELISILKNSKRPVLLLGGLISRSLAWSLFPKLEKLGIPIMTATSAIDRVPSTANFFAGRPGSWGGQRAANLLLAQSDCLIGLGVQWDLQQTGFNWQNYAPGADIYQIYPDEVEISKGHPILKKGFVASPDDIFLTLVERLETWVDNDDWMKYVQMVRRNIPIMEPLNSSRQEFVPLFKFLNNLSLSMRPDDVLALTSSGGGFTGGLQVCELGHRQYATTSPAFASMGYGLATAIGAAIAQPGKRVVHIEGDGGFSQKLQELGIVRNRNLPIKMFVLDNGGYGSIRATQKKFFNGEYVGCDETTGLGFPNWVTLFNAYGIDCNYLNPNDLSVDSLSNLLSNSDGPQAWIASIDPEQTNYPSVVSRLMPNGKLESSPLSDQQPSIPEHLKKLVSQYVKR